MKLVPSAAILSMFSLVLLPIGASAQVPAEPTFADDIAPIFYDSCVTCHRPGEIAPMSLISYQDVRPWARSIKNKVETRAMPPWPASSAPVESAFAVPSTCSLPKTASDTCRR